MRPQCRTKFGRRHDWARSLEPRKEESDIATETGIDVTVKDSKRFAKTNNWGLFTFGHHPLPYAKSAAEAPATECASCHQANVAKTDMTWVQFYPLLRDKDPTK
jgi:hypothetical protein